MKIICVLALAALLASSAPAKGRSVHVKGSTSLKTGRTTPPHQRTAPNKTERDNWSSKGNTNPTTGKEGKREPKK